jgi:hypothetical protein
MLVNYKKQKQLILFNIESQFPIKLNIPILLILFFRPMPDIDGLMQEWPTQFEELLREVFVINDILLNRSFILLDICSIS